MQLGTLTVSESANVRQDLGTCISKSPGGLLCGSRLILGESTELNTRRGRGESSVVFVHFVAFCLGFVCLLRKCLCDSAITLRECRTS